MELRVREAPLKLFDTVCTILKCLYSESILIAWCVSGWHDIIIFSLWNFSELLDVYREAVLSLEQRMQSQEYLPLLEIQQHLNVFEVVFPEVARMVEEIDKNNLLAADIMNKLMKRSLCGIPPIMACCNRLLWHCRQIFLKQLESWTLYGEVVDPTKEFLIQNTNDSAASAESDLSFLEHFYVSTAALPPGLSMEEADAILFAGKATRILLKTNKSNTSFHSYIQAPEFKTFYKFLSKAKSSNAFDGASQRHALESLRIGLALKVWTLLNHECQLKSTLKSMHELYLLGRGDIFQQFLYEAADVLQKSPHEISAEPSISMLFSNILEAKQYEDGANQKFRGIAADLYWFPPDQTREKPSWHPKNAANLFPPSFDEWDDLILHVSPSWPVALFFTPSIHRNYIAMWRLLFRIKRVEDCLESVWAELSIYSRKALKKEHNISMSNVKFQNLALFLSNMRGRMAHFISNIALYLRIDVIESASRKLFSRLDKCKDFQTAETIHQEFIDKLVSESCLDVKQLMTAIEGIFKQINNLYDLVKGLENCSSQIDQYQKRAVEIDEAFSLKHNLVFQILQSKRLREHQRAEVLQQLLLRLNFNKWCERDVLRYIRNNNVSI